MNVLSGKERRMQLWTKLSHIHSWGCFRFLYALQHVSLENVPTGDCQALDKITCLCLNLTKVLVFVKKIPLKCLHCCINLTPLRCWVLFSHLLFYFEIFFMFFAFPDFVLLVSYTRPPQSKNLKLTVREFILE